MQQIGSPENQFSTPLASKTLSITHHRSPGSRPEASALFLRFRFLWVLLWTAPERDAQFFSQGGQAADSARGAIGAITLQSSSCSSQGSEAAPWPSQGHRSRLAPGRLASAQEDLLSSASVFSGRGAGGSDQAKALGTLS